MASLMVGHCLFIYLRSFPIPSDNRALPINRKQKVFPNGTLIIENVERNSDQASYTCVAKNAEGFIARGAIEIEVMGKLMFYAGVVSYIKISGKHEMESPIHEESGVKKTN